MIETPDVYITAFVCTSHRCIQIRIAVHIVTTSVHTITKISK